MSILLCKFIDRLILTGAIGSLLFGRVLAEEEVARSAAAGSAAAAEVSRFRYPVTRLHVEYAPTLAGLTHSLPPIEELTKSRLELGETREGLTAADRPGARKVTIAPVEDGHRIYAGDALLAVSNHLVKELNKRGIFGVYVLPAASQIDATTGEDRRAHKTDLTLEIYVSVVNAVHTTGQRVPLKAAAQPAVDSPSHARIRAHSPIVPASAADSARSLLREDALQDYITRINRYPGRRVDASVNPTDEPGRIALDYAVQEQKPWLAFIQASNTGTSSTGEWRTRVGFEERQLLGLDDTLHLDYTTSDFSGYQSASFSYDFAPIFPDYLKLKTYFNWGRYSAADIGVQISQFEGQTFTTGESITWTPLYIRNFPLDITAGLEWQNISTSNDTFFGGDFPR